LGYKEWLDFATWTLVPNLRSSWVTMQKLVNVILDHHDARNFFVEKFLRSGKNQILKNDDSIRMAEYLAAEGLVMRVESAKDVNTFKIASPLVGTLAMWALHARDFAKNIPEQRAPFTVDMHLDILKIVTTGLPYFNSKNMTDAPYVCCKRSRNVVTKKDTQVPHEAWVINFFTAVKESATPPFVDNLPYDISLIQVVHDLDWACVYLGNDTTPNTVNLLKIDQLNLLDKKPL
jgi:hypothetical protein